jgi:hypothetical protein
MAGDSPRASYRIEAATARKSEKSVSGHPTHPL